MTTITIPDSLSRCDDAVIVAKAILDQLASDVPITSEDVRWAKADVRSLQRYDIDFTDEETTFFDQCLAQLSERLDA